MFALPTMIELKAVGHLERFMIGTGRTVLFKCQCHGRKEKLQWQKQSGCSCLRISLHKTMLIMHCNSAFNLQDYCMPWCYRSHWHVLHDIHINSQSLWARLASQISSCSALQGPSSGWFITWVSRLAPMLGSCQRWGRQCAFGFPTPICLQTDDARHSNLADLIRIQSLEIPRCCSLWMYVVHVWLASLCESHTGKAELLFSEMLAKGVGPNQKGFGSLAEGVLGSHVFSSFGLPCLTALPTPFQYTICLLIKVVRPGWCRCEMIWRRYRPSGKTWQDYARLLSVRRTHDWLYSRLPMIWLLHGGMQRSPVGDAFAASDQSCGAIWS